MSRFTSLLAGGSAVAALIAGSVVVGSTAMAETSGEPMAPMSTFDPELPRELGSGDLRRVFSYSCSLQGEGLEAEASSVRVEIESTIPKEVDPGDTIASQPFKVEVTLPDSAYEAVAALGATHQEWTVPVGLTMRAGYEAPTVLPGFDVSVPRERLTGVPWRLTMNGTLPPIAVPNLMHTPGGEWYQHELWLDMPEQLTIGGALQTPNGEIATTLACDGPADRALGGTWVTTWPRPTDATPPTSEPTTEPTTVPTSDPGPEPGGPIDLGPGTLSRTVNYRCAANAGGLFLGIQDFTLDATADYLETAVPGDVLTSRPVSVTLTANELLRQAITRLLGAREADGAGDPALSMTTAGRTTELEPTAWDFPRSDIPQVDNTAWTMRGTGTIPAVTVPQDATGALWLGLPAQLKIDSTLYKEDNSTIPMVLECAAGSDRLLGGVALLGETDPTPPELDTPDQPTWPTNPPPTDTPPTWDPTDPPTTSFPSDPPTEPVGEPPVGPGEVYRTLPYRCAVIAGGLDLGIHAVTVLASTDVPATAWPGEVLGPRPLGLTVTVPELLRQSTALLLGAQEHEAAATDLALSLKSNDRTTSLSVPEVRFPRASVPQEVNEPWLMAGSGEIPPITVPGDATNVLWLGTPANVGINVTLYKADNSTIPMTLSCTGPLDRRFGGITLEGPPTEGPTSDPTTEPTVEPTTEPTIDPTTEPTSDPTTAPTPPALIQPNVKVGALGLWRSAVFTIGVAAKGALPTGNVVVKRGDKTVAKGRLFLGVTVLTAGNLPRGEHSFTITYEGDGKVAAKSVTKKVRIL